MVGRGRGPVQTGRGRSNPSIGDFLDLQVYFSVLFRAYLMLCSVTGVTPIDFQLKNTSHEFHKSFHGCVVTY